MLSADCASLQPSLLRFERNTNSVVCFVCVFFFFKDLIQRTSNYKIKKPGEMKGRMRNGEGKRSLCISFWRIYIRSVVLTESAVQIYLAQCQSLLPQRCYSRGITACHFILSRVILSYFLIHRHAICLNHPCRWIHKQAILIKKIDTSLFLHASQRFAFTRGEVRLGCVLIDFPPEFAQSLLELVAAVSSVAQ